jgi:hypothetical protein
MERGKTLSPKKNTLSKRARYFSKDRRARERERGGEMEWTETFMYLCVLFHGLALLSFSLSLSLSLCVCVCVCVYECVLLYLSLSHLSLSFFLFHTRAHTEKNNHCRATTRLQSKYKTKNEPPKHTRMCVSTNSRTRCDINYMFFIMTEKARVCHSLHGWSVKACVAKI